MTRTRGTYLIGHDHETAVSEGIDGIVNLSVLQSHDLLDRLNLGVVHESLSSRFSYVEELSSKWEDSVVVSTDDGESGNGERFGGISFGENEGTFRSCSTTGVVGIFELDESSDTAAEEVLE